MKVNFWQEARALAREGDLSSAMKSIENHPQGAMQLCIHGKTIRKELKRLLPPKAGPPLPLGRPLADFDIPVWNKQLTLVLHGRSNMGKTSLACSLIPSACIVNELDALRRFDPKTNGGIIFDDMKLPMDRELHLALIDRMKETQVRVRYKNVTIPIGTLTIFCSNWEPQNYFYQVPEVMRRLEIWHPTSPGVFIKDQ